MKKMKNRGMSAKSSNCKPVLSRHTQYIHKVNSKMGLMFFQNLFSLISLLPVAGCMSDSAISEITPTWDFRNMQRCNGKKQVEKQKRSTDCLLARRLCLYCAYILYSVCMCVCVCKETKHGCVCVCSSCLRKKRCIRGTNSHLVSCVYGLSVSLFVCRYMLCLGSIYYTSVYLCVCWQTYAFMLLFSKFRVFK